MSTEKKFFRGFVCNTENQPDYFDIYFPEDSEHRLKTPAEEMRPLPERETGFWSRNLNSFCDENHTFQRSEKDEHPGDWQILELDLKDYLFKCKRTTTGAKGVIKNFDIGDVMRIMKKQMESQCES